MSTSLINLNYLKTAGFINASKPVCDYSRRLKDAHILIQNFWIDQRRA